MVQKFSKTLGDLNLPENFPHLEFDSVNAKMANYAQNPSSNWFMFAAAWNATGYRAIATHKSSARFDELLANSAASLELRFLQDHEMFSFFTAALSAIECAFFATYACVSQAFPSDYPIALDKDLRVTPEKIFAKMKAKHGSTAIVNAMKDILSDPQYAELSNFRNYLAHRGILPRKQYAATGPGAVDLPSDVSGNPTQLASSWIYNFKLVPGCLIPFVDFTDKAIGSIVQQLHDFATVDLK
ncbi:hypothetical protein [Massilia sp. 9096]|uniref:hypothetical protein n=1 Tax=Massilia sp. 9096 TaxID=1500894 RepID=UPI0012E098F4|nr:hypothetical protein [Massilia sp. 9096]